MSDVPAWVLGRAATYSGEAKTETLAECVLKYGDSHVDIIPPTPQWLVDIEPAYTGVPPPTAYTSSGFLFNPRLFNPSSYVFAQQSRRQPDLDKWFLSEFAADVTVPPAMLATTFNGYCSRLYYAQTGSNPPDAQFTYVSPNLRTVMISRGNATALVGINQALVPVALQDGDTVAAYAALVSARSSAAAGIIAQQAEAHAMNLAAAEEYGAAVVSGGDYFGGDNPSVMNPMYYYPTSSTDANGLTVAGGINSATVLLIHSYQQGTVTADWYSVRVTISGVADPGTGSFAAFSDNGVRYSGVLYKSQSGAFRQASFDRYNDYSVMINGGQALPAIMPIAQRIGWATSSQFKRGSYQEWSDSAPPYLNVAVQNLWVYAPIFDPLAIPSTEEIFTPPVLVDYNPTAGAMFDFSTGAVAYFTFLNTYQLDIARTTYQQIKFGTIVTEDKAASLEAQKAIILGLITVQFNNGVSDDWIAFGASPGKLTTVIQAKSEYDV